MKAWLFILSKSSLPPLDFRLGMQRSWIIVPKFRLVVYWKTLTKSSFIYERGSMLCVFFHSLSLLQCVHAHTYRQRQRAYNCLRFSFSFACLMQQDTWTQANEHTSHLCYIFISFIFGSVGTTSKDRVKVKVRMEKCAICTFFPCRYLLIYLRETIFFHVRSLVLRSFWLFSKHIIAFNLPLWVQTICSASFQPFSVASRFNLISKNKIKIEKPKFPEGSLNIVCAVCDDDDINNNKN